MQTGFCYRLVILHQEKHRTLRVYLDWRSLFYAGTRSLLVSHWKVESKATVKLITGMFKNIANDNNIGKSEALRRSDDFPDE